MNENNLEVKVCKKCGRILPIDKFRIVRGQFHNPYYLGHCKECEGKDARKYLEEKNKITFSENVEMLIDIQYKKIKPERILDLTNLKINPIGTDEIFVKLMDYKNTWLSNYGRVIRYSDKQYSLLQGGYDGNGAVRYYLRKNVFFDGKWIYKGVHFYAAPAVVREFIINPDQKNNIYIWHSGYNKQDCYYRNLYPLNQEQYRIVKKNFMKTGDDSEEFIRNVINETKYKPDDWSKRAMQPIMCGIGYRGSEDVDLEYEAYTRWHDMIHRCYNDKFHERQSQYKECTVCDEWLNYSNFKVWYDKNKYGKETLDLDKDILFKGNTIYGPETVCFVPHAINTLFVNGKKGRGELPLGVYYESEKEKYCTCMAFRGKSIKLGRFDTPEDAFAKYKEYKENLIKDVANQYREKIPYKVYDAMMNWKVEITD